MLKKAVVDIDNTLWNFSEALYEGLKEVNNAVPSPAEWIDWDFWEKYCSEDQFFAVTHRIHMNQNDDSYLPYSEAKNFLDNLKKQNFHIVIASHRTPNSSVQTEKWLFRHNLVFDELHLSNDKTVLFDATCHIVVDDSPFVLDKAKEKGILTSGLQFPWNSYHSNNGYMLFSDLNKVSDYLNDKS